MTPESTSLQLARALRGVLRCSNRAHRWGTYLERMSESLRLAPQLPPDQLSQWRISNKYQALFDRDFGAAADHINHGEAERLYAIYLPEQKRVLAAALFYRSGVPGGGLLLVELAMMRPLDPLHSGQRHPATYLGALLLLETLHALKRAEGGPTDIWLRDCHGLKDDEAVGLGFEPRPANGLDASHVRRDDWTPDEGHWLRRSLDRIVERLR
jgi:hypothetical protein